jgi:transporter family protein
VVTDDIDAYRSQILFTLGLIPLVVFVLGSRRTKPVPQQKRGVFYAFVTGILGGTGNIAFFEALSLGGKAAIVVPMTAMSPLVTVVLARVFLRERLSRTQVFGLVLALAAIYLLSL